MNHLLRFFRKSSTLLCLLIIGLAQAQTVNTTYKTQINAKLAGLDKSKITTGLLLNQAMEFAELSDYSGALTTTNLATRAKYTAVYNTLLMACVRTSVPGLVSPTVFDDNWDALRAPNTIVLSGLYYQYSKFRPDAYPNYLVNNGGVITDKYVGGVWQNPYIDQAVFAITAPILEYKSLSLQVTLPASLWYTNQAATVQNIAVDFGNGLGYQNLTFGQNLSLNYAVAGTYEWKYKLTLNNGQILYSHSKLKIDVPSGLPSHTCRCLASTGKITTDLGACSDVISIPFTGSRQYLGKANTANLQIKYAQNNCKITKPLIVVEGFDSGLQANENPNGEVDYISFRNSYYKSGSYSLYAQISSYDVIYINFNQGRDYLQRNAYLVEDIIKWVNAQKATGSAPNVVIGQSMGGVIARYALRDMEVLGQAHQANLYISHDAPQQGANIPLGVQYFVRHLGDQFLATPFGDKQISMGVSVKDLQNLLDAPGTRQLLANSLDSNFNLNNNRFNTFQTELRNLGYPTQTRNIALSDGSHCAIPQEFSPSATLFSLHGGASTTALGTFATTLLQPFTGLAFAGAAYEFNEPGLLLGLLPGSSSFDMDFNANALPAAGTTNQIYHGSISYTKKLFSLFGWDPQITVSLTDRGYNNPVALSYDYYPGGKFQLPFKFENSTYNSVLITSGVSAYIAPTYNFIPVTSALDIGSGRAVLTNSDYLRKYNAVTPPVAPFNSPFANFTTSFPEGANQNDIHISFNRRNGDWLATELNKTVVNKDFFDCTYICSDAQIIGIDKFCSSATYAAINVVPSYNWVISQGSNLVTITGNGTQNITLTRTSDTSGGIVVLSLNYGDSGRCGSKTITKTITLDPLVCPYFPTLVDYSCSFDPGTYAPCVVSNAPHTYSGLNSRLQITAAGIGSTTANEWEWENISGRFNFTGPNASANGKTAIGNDFVYINFTNEIPDTIQFRCRVKNTCAAGVWKNFIFNFSDGSPVVVTPPVPSEYFTFSPNPAGSTIDISLKDPNILVPFNSTIGVSVYTVSGTLLISNTNLSSTGGTLYVGNLTSRTGYLLKIQFNSTTETHYLIKN
jgi:hypothetical protein